MNHNLQYVDELKYVTENLISLSMECASVAELVDRTAILDIITIYNRDGNDDRRPSESEN